MAEAKSDRQGASATIASVELLRGLTSAVDEVFATMISTLGLGTKLGDPCLLDPARAASSMAGAGAGLAAQWGLIPRLGLAPRALVL
ncbi:MAG: hypothetical protein ABI054_09810, partial [Planctomycetota bacterium]